MGPAHGPATSELEQARTAPEFGAHTPLAEKLLAVAIRAQNFTGSSGVAIALTEGQDMVCRASWGTSAPDVGAKLSTEHSFTGLCVRTGEPLRCDDAQSDPRVDPEACRALGISAIAVAPVRRGLKVVGVIAAFSDTPSAFTDKHLLILTTLSEVIVELLDESQPSPPAAQAVTPPAPATVVDPTLLGYDVSAPRGKESAAVFEDELLSAVEEPAAKAPDAGRESRNRPTTTVQPEIPMAVSPLRQSSTTPARTQPPGAADRLEAPRKKRDDIAPPASQQDRGAKAASASSVRLVTLNQPAADSSPPLTFGGYETGEETSRRWWLVAAILILFSLVGWALWRWHVRSEHMAVAASTAPLVPQSPPASQPAATPELKSADPVPADTKRSAFTPATTAPSAAKPAPPSEAPDDVTIRRSPEAVIETDEPVRRPAAGGKSRTAQVPEAQAPQLALSSPELPAVLAKPATAAAVTAPVSHIIPPQLVSRVPPVYPEAARRLNISGKVVLKATISKNGSVANLQWVSGNELFRSGALAAVKQWRYKPAILNSQPIDSELQIVLEFYPRNR